MNITLLPLENLSHLKNFLEFNSIPHNVKSIWQNNLYDYSLLENNSLVIVNFDAFIDTIQVQDSLKTLIAFLSQNNHLLVYNDIDGIIRYYHLEQHLQKLNDLDESSHISFILDGYPLKTNNDHRFKLYSMPNSHFEMNLSRKKFLDPTNSRKDFILTIGRQSIERDLLWNNLQAKNLLQNGFARYHKKNRNYSAWLGTKSSIHNWHDGHPSTDLYNNSYFEIVPETFYQNTYFVTEKTVKPISCKLPFLILSTPGYLEFLKSKGYNTFGSIIDESYDKETDLQKRIGLITDQVEYIVSNGSEKFYKQSQAIREHNYSNLAKIAGSWWSVMDEFFYNVITTISKQLH